MAACQPSNQPPNQIYIQAVSQSQVQTAIQQASNTLVLRHRIKPGAVNDFEIRNLSQFIETAESSSRIMALLLAAGSDLARALTIFRIPIGGLNPRWGSLFA